MCSINHDLKAIYLHIPKNGGLYIQNILEKYYNFKTIYFTRSDHYLFDKDENKDNNIENYKNITNGFINIRKQGVFRYYSTSKEFNEMSGMNDEKWQSYYKFTFTRNPYSKIVSAFKYIVKDEQVGFEDFLDKRDIVNNYIYTHAFITQYDHLINKDNNIDYNFIGKFENLNQDLITILFELGIKKIKHANLIKDNIKINKSKNINPYVDYYNTNNLPIINQIFEKDFNNLNYKQYNDIIDFNENYSKDNFESSNKELYAKLLEEDKIDFIQESESISLTLDDNTKLNLDSNATDSVFVNNLVNESMNLENNKNKPIPVDIIIKLFQNLKCTGLVNPNSKKVKIVKKDTNTK
jgi:hypothetical protein